MIKNIVIRRAVILFGLVVLACLLLFWPLFRFRFARLPSVRFGHTLMNSEIYLCKRLREGKTFPLPIRWDFIFLMDDFVPNVALATIVKRYLPVYPSSLIYPIWVWVHRLHLMSMQIPEIDRMMTDSQNFLGNTRPQLQLSDYETGLAQEELASIGLKSQQPWVCLFSRSSQFLLNGIPDLYEDSARGDVLRNSDPRILFETTKELVRLGYMVIFMGKSSGHNYELFKNVFKRSVLIREDLDISDLADLYLGSACEFFISSPSGAENPADVLGRRPILNFDVITIANQAIYLPTKLSIFKLQFSLKLGRYLRLEEMKRIGSHCFTHSNEFAHAGIELVSNTASDILNLTHEFLYLRDHGWDHTVLPNNGKLNLELNKVIGLDVPRGYPPARRDRILRYAEGFLEKHYDILF